MLRKSPVRSVVSLLLCGSLAAGCAGLSAGPRAPIPDIESAIFGSAGVEGLQASYTPEKINNCLAEPLNGPGARQCRDEIVQGLTTVINLRFAQFEVGFFDANRYANFASTVAIIGLGAAGAVSGTNAAQALSAAAAAMAGVQTAMNRELLFEQTAAALLTAMRAQRNMVDLRIRTGLRLAALDYPLGAALSDVYALYRAGTIPGALASLTQIVGSQGQAAQERLVLGTGLARGSSATALQNFVETGATPEIRRERNRAVREAARAEGFGDVVVASFIRDASPGNEARLDRVARRLGLMP